jgi:hypothetical protein
LPLRGTHGIRLLVGFHLFGTSDHIDLPEHVVSRLLCHALIQHLPDAALPDAIESLTSDYEMHEARKALPKSLPEPGKKTIKARLGERRFATLPPIIEID